MSFAKISQISNLVNLGRFKKITMVNWLQWHCLKCLIYDGNYEYDSVKLSMQVKEITCQVDWLC